jgi:hypothetical protein
MKKLFSLLLFFIPVITMGQSVAINTDGSTADNTSILDIKSNAKGILIPRLTTAERTGIVSPAIGLTVFDNETVSFWTYRGDLMGGWVELLHSLDKHWNRTGSHIFTTNGSGNVGIGTSSPTEKLAINATNPAIRFLNANTEKGFLQADGNDMKLGTYNSNATGNIFFNIRGINRMIVTSEGDIGVGISTPVGRFQIGTGSVASLVSHGYLMLGPENGSNLIFDNNEILARSNGNHSNLYLQNTGGNVFIGDATNFNSAHRLGVDGNAVITGNMRVGNTVGPSGYRLAVDGKAICTELLVRTVPNWPDYVFNKQYKLPGLQEVEDFISKYNHLPGIPSAKELETNGLNIGEMQKLQMEKIEELTLYIIELKKEIEKLKTQK